MSTIGHITTAEQLFNAGDIGRCELVRGELIMMSPANPEHARIMARMSHLLMTWIDAHPEAGEVWSGDPGFIIQRDPDTVRAPDIALVDRGEAGRMQKSGFVAGAPRLAIEIISPSDSAGDMLTKVQDWLEAGCDEVWVVNPGARTVTVYRADKPMRALREQETLTDSPVLPGFALRVADVFR